MKASKKFKKYYKALIGVVTLGVAPLFLSSCASVSSDLIDDSVSKGDGKNFATNYSIATIAKNALKNQTSATKFFDQQIGELVLSWYESLASSNKYPSIKTAYEDQKESVDDDYDSTVKNSRDSNGADFPLKFQQDELDIHGGSESSWKKEKMLTWAIDKFKTDVFNNFYFSIVDNNNNVISKPSTDQIKNALLNTSNKTNSNITGGDNQYYFGFATNPDTDRVNLEINKEYANFQKFIYDEWVKSENPFVVGISGWKYGTPTNGLKTLYDSKALDTTTAGTYQFPYFSDKATSNSSVGTIQKFTNFVNDSKNTANYIDTSLDTNKDIGLIKFNSNNADESKFVFIKSSTMTTDSNINTNIAAAISYLFGNSFTGSSVTDANISKAISLTSSDGFDIITSNFISSTAINNFAATATTKLSASYMTSIINSEGILKNWSNKEAYVIDAFKPSDANLNNFIFLRDKDGIKAVTIDGLNLISKAADLNQAKQLAANVAAYRYFLNKEYPSINDNVKNLSIDIKSELSSFFTSNFDYLIYKYATSDETKNNQNMFDVNKTFVGNLQTVLNAYSNYVYESSRYNRRQVFEDALFSEKSTYGNSYGVSAKKNGLAAKWVYKYKEADNTNPTRYELSQIVEVDGVNNPYITNGTYQTYLNTIESYVNSLNLSPLSSDFEGFKYSQYIYSNDFFINQALLSLGSDSNALSDPIKQDILFNYIGNSSNVGFDDYSYLVKNDFFSSISNWTQTEDYSQSINNALNNEFFNTTFSGLTNKWTKYTKTSADSKISQSDLNSYRLSLWKDSNAENNSTSSSAKLSLLTILATTKYLLEDNGQRFLDYLKTQIAVGTTGFIVWENSINTTLQKDSANLNKAETLLSSNNIYQNINNSANSAYHTLDSTNNAIDLNNQSSAFNSATNYYSVVGDKIGFLGLQNSSSDTISSYLQNILFKSPYSYNDDGQQVDNGDPTGILFAYAKSYDDFKTYIDSLTYVSSVSTLTTDLTSLLSFWNFDGSKVNKASGLADKKQELKNELDRIKTDHSADFNKLFERKSTYIGLKNLYGDNLSSDVQTKYGSYVIQLNQNDFESWSSLKTALTYKNITDAQAMDIIMNLVIKAASDSNQQSNAISSILSTRKVEVYDERLNAQLGAQWASNWK